MVLRSQPIIAFVATTRLEAARQFYADVIGLKLARQSPFALVFEVAGTMLHIQKVQEILPQPHTVLGWLVSDIREEIQGLASKGVTFERYSGLTQDELGVWTAPDGHKVAWFHDQDDNTLSLTEPPAPVQ